MRSRLAGTLVPAVGVILVLAMPFMTTDRYLFKVLTFVGLNLIVVAGLALLFGYAGQISLGHAAFFGIGAYTAGYLTGEAAVPWLVATLVAALLAALVGFVLSLPMLRLKGHYLAMATLGFSEIMTVLFIEARGITGGNDGLRGIPYPSLGSFKIDTPSGVYLLVWITAIVVLVLAANLVRTRPGRALRALHGAELGAQACGIDTGRLRVQVFALSAGLAGLAGALYASAVGFISPTTFSLEFSVLLVAMVVLGGTGSVTGPVVACVLLTLLPYVDALVPGLPREVVSFLQDWEADIAGIVMILVLLFAPGGVAGLLRRSPRVGEAE
ncbi:MAG: branched-chain amino acid ABC transporter permease [Actinobacteria bacterium HGW-Actinobacteria-1]|jgi:branched-chain amino acid transport system permease protein|nr:MAG: branched-chain amino acid ABC transporter permease [Actinobacteria bacterium HGW-Actinobacteria-1]